MISRVLALAVLTSSAYFCFASVGCTSGTTPDCSGADSGCGPGFDGPPPDTGLPPGDGATGEEVATPEAMSPEAGTDVGADVIEDVISDVPAEGPGEAASPGAG